MSAFLSMASPVRLQRGIEACLSDGYDQLRQD